MSEDPTIRKMHLVHEFATVHKKMDPIFHGSDIIMVNLECPITDSNKILPKQFNFKANPDYANILTEAGINIVTLANNHVYDFSSEGLEAPKYVS